MVNTRDQFYLFIFYVDLIRSDKQSWWTVQYDETIDPLLLCSYGLSDDF